MSIGKSRHRVASHANARGSFRRRAEWSDGMQCVDVKSKQPRDCDFADAQHNWR